jgi:transposase
MSQISRELGISYYTLRNWCKVGDVAKRKRKKSEPIPAPGSAEETVEAKVVRLEREVQQLRKEKASLEMDREILKKAAAFFAKESE